MAQKRRKRRKSLKRAAKLRRRRLKVLVGLVFACSVLVFSITYAVFHRYVSRFPDNKICKNVYIGMMDMSGMTEKEAKEALEKQKEADQELMVTIKVEDNKVEMPFKEVGLTYNGQDKLVKEAMDYGKKGNMWSRYFTLHKLEKEKYVLSESIAFDEALVTTFLNDQAVPLARHAVNATITKSAVGFDIEEEQKGETVDVEATAKKLKKHLNNNWDHKAFSVKAVLEEENPTVTAEDLGSIQDELGSFSTDAGGGERWKNLKTGVEKLNGTVLMPGQELSVHDVTAPYDAEHGYAPAGSYENGQVVETYGGGICQVSSTLYNAVLYAELEIVKRYPHSMLVAYVQPSRDAAIAGDTKDFVFKNNYETPIYIFGEIDSSNQLRFVIYGKETREEGRTVEYEPEIISTEEPETTYKTNSEASLGSMQTTGSPHTGKVVRLWKIVKINGEQVSREEFNNSTYQKSDKVIEVGTKSDNAAASSLVANAVATQDKDKINAAIAQAKGMGGAQ